MPRPFAKRLEGHAVQHTSDLGWEQLSNGALLRAARQEGFEAMITVDKRLPDQQRELPIPVTVLAAFRNSEARLIPLIPGILSLLSGPLQPRAYVLPSESR